MAIVYLFLAIVIIIGGLAICYIIFYNLIQYSNTKIEQAESIIDETLRTRYDMIIRADNIIRATLEEDKSYFKGLEQLKKSNISNFDLDRKISEFIQLFEQIKTDHPTLEKNQGVKDITKEINSSGEKLCASKAYYNRNVTDYNKYIRIFPANIIARIHNLSQRTYFDNKNMRDDIIDDFKL